MSSLLQSFEKSLDAIDTAISLKPKEALLRANRGIILARSGRFSEALLDCEQAIQQAPKEVSGYYGKACCYALQGKIKETVDNLQIAFELSPRLTQREARCNPDFDHIRDDERFRALIYP